MIRGGLEVVGGPKGRVKSGGKGEGGMPRAATVRVYLVVWRPPGWCVKSRGRLSWTSLPVYRLCG